MPLFFIRQDITKMQCDAIVNSTNRYFKPLGGADASIHKTAGPELAKYCSTLGVLNTGEVKITPAFNLPCKYVIHTVGPVWHGGKNGEETILQNCYTNALKMAVENGCKSIAIPLISSGTYGYPKDKVLSVAIDAICSFLFQNDLTVYLVIFTKEAYAYTSKLFKEIETYIDDNYVAEHLIAKNERTIENDLQKKPQSSVLSAETEDAELDKMLSKADESFALMLMRFIDKSGMTEVECYKKAGVLKQTWYKILNDKNYRPKKETVISYAIALKLSLDDTQRLLATVGYTLSKSNKFDIIIRFFISHKIYDVFKINQYLNDYKQPLLGC